MNSFPGKKIWIVGCSSGIGRALAVELALAGASLILSARDGDKLAALNNELGGGHLVCPLDVGDPAAMAATVETIGPVLDSAIYMAGAYQPMALDRLDMDVTRTVIDTNLTGAFTFVHAVLPLLLAQKNRAQIALCGSVAGYRGLPMGQPYGATKAALINLAESLRAETGRRGLDVKIINPGFVKTRLTEKNTFRMPTMIEPDAAARAIVRGLQSKKFEIHFPLRLTLLMKLLRALPAPLYFKLVQK